MRARPADLLTAFFAAVLILALPAAGAQQAQKYDALLGTWDVKTEDGSREFVFEFSLKDGKLVGKYTGGSGTLEMTDLTFENNTAKFNVTVGNDMVITYSAIVADGQLSGMLSLQFGEAAITGTKRK
jgi:hypothetical protein